MMTLITVDLTDKEEIALLEKNFPQNPDVANIHLKHNRTQMGYVKETGFIMYVVEEGKLILVSPDNDLIKIKSIWEDSLTIAEN